MRPQVTAEQTCPLCRTTAEHPPAVRQGPLTTPEGPRDYIDVGWRCVACRHAWGFEVWTDGVLEALADQLPPGLMVHLAEVRAEREALTDLLLWLGPEALFNTCPGDHTFGRCDRDNCDYFPEVP